MPEDSCTFGPGGAAGAAGGLPRPAGISLTSKVRLPGIQSMGSLSAAFTVKPGSFRALAVAVSATHNSMPLAVVCVKAKCFPSGLHCGNPIFGLGGSTILLSTPSAIRFSTSETK